MARRFEIKILPDLAAGGPLAHGLYRLDLGPSTVLVVRTTDVSEYSVV